MNSLMIRASAGSGKTFQLSNRFLALLAAGAAPTELIALTFTRKAAGEFADRILSRLAEGSLEEAQALALARELSATLQGDAASGMPPLSGQLTAPTPDLAQFRALLEALAKDLHRITLSTLDSFFVRIAKQFPYELGLSGFELLESDRLQGEKKRVLSHIFRTVPERQREAFLGAFRLATHGREQARLSALLDEFLEMHHQRFLSAPERDRWGNLDRIWPRGCPWPQIEDFHAAAQRVIGLLNTVGVKNQPHGGWLNAWEKAAEWFANYQPGDGQNTPSALTRTLTLLDDLRNGDAVDVFSRMEHRISGALAQAMADLAGGYLRAELEVRSTRTLGLWSILYAYESLYEKQVRLRGRLGFSDVTRVLAQGGLTEDGRARMESRLDARYNHWLLDEFQDTSRAQWAVLAGLAAEAVLDAEERRSLFVVGDTKQGIYGWRGGEPRLFDDLLEQPGWDQRMREWRMETSWRSAPQVLSLVNRICDPAGPGMRGRFPAAVLARWRFAEHHSAGRAASCKGYAAVLETTKREDEDEEEALHRTACDVIASVAPLERGLSCAVLVRSNKNAHAVADALRLRFPKWAVEVDSEVELALDNPAGLALLDLFRWLAHPQDRMAWGHVSHSPLRLALPEDEEECWKECRKTLREEGVAALVEQLFAAMRKHGVMNDFLAQRAQGIAREAHASDQAGERSPEAWVRRLEALVQRERSSEGAIQVMTVHKAKGLEFDMVVAADLGGGSAFDDPSRAGILEFRDAAGAPLVMLLPPRKELLLADRDLRKLYDRWVSDQCVERFCNLYVALTRAKNASYVILPEAPKSAENAMRYDLWIRGALEDRENEPLFAEEPVILLHEEGDRGWFQDTPFTGEQEPEKAIPSPLGEGIPRRGRRQPSTPGPAARHSEDASEWGVEVHRAFQRIGWVDEELSPFPSTPAEREVADLLDVPEIRKHFERRGRAVELFREQPIDVLINGEWLSGSLDRLEIEREATGRVTQVTLIDFKTGEAKPAELMKRYRPQMEAYRAALTLIYPDAGVRRLILSTRLRKVIEMTSA